MQQNMNLCQESGKIVLTNQPWEEQVSITIIAVGILKTLQKVFP
jgi:hypothetical protein